MSRRFVVLALVLAWPAAVLGVTFRVPQDHALIQAAIDLASTTRPDTILVSAGTYFERLSIRGKPLVLRGAGQDVTTLDGQFGGNVVTLNRVQRNTIIEDLTITGGDATDPDSVGAAIYLNQYASPTIQRCRLIGNRARAGGGLNAYVQCLPLIRDCSISDNEGGACVFELGDADNGSTWAEVQNTVISRNAGVGVYVLKGARVIFQNCTIAFNASDGVRSDQIGRVKVLKSIVTHNQGAGIARLDNTVCLTLACNDVFGNTQGNYLGAIPGDPCFPGRGNGDVTIDPCYQNAAASNFHLQRTSPLCALRGPDSCGVLGAFEDPCGPGSSPCVVRVEASTWSTVKSRYR